MKLDIHQKFVNTVNREIENYVKREIKLIKDGQEKTFFQEDGMVFKVRLVKIEGFEHKSFFALRGEKYIFGNKESEVTQEWIEEMLVEEKISQILKK